MYNAISTPELCYALACLIRDDETPYDDEERERLAVALIREVCDREELPNAREMAIASEANRVRQNWKCAESFTFAERSAFASLCVDAEQQANRNPEREPYTFTRSLPNGLCWVA